MTVQELKDPINLGDVALAIISAKGDRGAFTDEITQSLLRLQQKLELEELDTRPGPTGTDSDRVVNIVAGFTVRDFVTDHSPYILTPEGDAWLKARLKESFDEQGLKRFWALVKRSLR
ncbi:hypothetical protein D4R54_01650 [archaeon]|nr:MAG: hypothetical protein D4R54_01650 [archaeon]